MAKSSNSTKADPTHRRRPAAISKRRPVRLEAKRLVRRHGYSRKRRYGKRLRWTALYLVAEPNTYFSAGTYDTKAEADTAWQEKLSQLRGGLISDPRKGRMPFEIYAEIYLGLMGHQKVGTKRGYRGQVRNQIVPAFQGLALDAVDYEQVSRWVTDLREAGYEASTIRTYKSLLSGMLAQAVRLGWIPANPAVQVKTPKEKPRRIKAANGEDISAIMAGLPGPISSTLVYLALQTGCRWGEISELRGADVLVNPDDPDCDYLWLQRAVVDAGLEGNPLQDGSRYYVEDTVKGGKDRRIGLSAPLSRRLRQYIRAQSVGPEDLLFSLSRLQVELREANPDAAPVVVAIPDDLGRTEPNAAGRTYAHGTLSAYNAGGCKCEWCRRAFAEYRARRRAAGKPDRPEQLAPKKPHAINTSDHIPDDWFRTNIWHAALEAANLHRRLTFHDLRHTHATWLARSERISVQELMERMGHASLETTQRYIDEADIVTTEAADVIDDMLSGAQPRRRRLRGISRSESA